MGEDSTPDCIEEGSVFFFRLFLHSAKVDKQKGEKVRNMFGPFPSTVVTQIGQYVQSVLIAIPALKDMLSPADLSHTPDPPQGGTQEHTESVLNSRPFGAEIRFNQVTSDVTDLPDNYLDEFTHALSVTNRDTMDNGVDIGDEIGIETQDSRFPPFWLLDQLKLLFLRGEARVKCGIVINILSSPEGTESVADSLFDCLGDTGIELVHTLLENRSVDINVVIGNSIVAS